jgi:hypothetical protein
MLGRSGGGHACPDADAELHESLTGLWQLAEYIPKRHYDLTLGREERRPNLSRRRTIPDGSLIHQAAYDRGSEYQKLLPANAVRVPW